MPATMTVYTSLDLWKKARELALAGRPEEDTYCPDGGGSFCVGCLLALARGNLDDEFQVPFDFGDNMLRYAGLLVATNPKCTQEEALAYIDKKIAELS